MSHLVRLKEKRTMADKPVINLNDQSQLEDDTAFKTRKTKKYDGASANPFTVDATKENVKVNGKNYPTNLSITNPGRLVSLIATIIRNAEMLSKPIKLNITGLKSLSVGAESKNERLKRMTRNRKGIAKALTNELMKNFPEIEVSYS